MTESWSEAETGSREATGRTRGRRSADPLEQGLDRLVSAGRQLVDGVSGARPGGRAPQGDGAGRGGLRAEGFRTEGFRRPRFDQLGRWVEDKLDWILDDEEDWREPWQEPIQRQMGRYTSPEVTRQEISRPEVSRPAPGSPAPQRRRLEAISRRSLRSGVVSSPDQNADVWPDDSSFSIPRWQRQPAVPQPPPADQPELPQGAAARPLPRSTRRRSANG